MFWADLGQLHFNWGQKGLTISLLLHCAELIPSVPRPVTAHTQSGGSTGQWVTVQKHQQKPSEEKGRRKKIPYAPPLNRQRYLQVLQSAKSHTEAHQAKPFRSLLIQDALVTIQSPSETQPFTSVGLLTRVRANQRAQPWSLLWSQPKGSGGAEISVAQRACAADPAQRAAGASPSARITPPQRRGHSGSRAGRDKRRKEERFLNEPARLKRAGWETRLLIEWNYLRWQRARFFQVCSTQPRCIFNEHCQLMLAHIPTPPNPLSAHPIKKLPPPPRYHNIPQNVSGIEKTQIYTLGSVLNSEYFCLLTRLELFPSCYQWKRKHIMWRLPEESKTFKKQQEKVSTKGLQQINLKRFRSSHRSVCS